MTAVERVKDLITAIEADRRGLESATTERELDKRHALTLALAHTHAALDALERAAKC